MQAYCGLHNSLDNPYSLDIVLVFQGVQGAAKTRFFEWIAMISCLFGEAVCLDPRNKDSVIQSTNVWLCELGEIDATMKKDIPALKGFLTTAVDKYRPPYGRNELSFVRRTSFVGTVNDPEYLVDQTGNRRFATIPLKPTVRLDVTTQIHTFDARQLWAQVQQIVNDELANGKTYANCFRLTPDELQQLDERNARHTKPLKGETEIRDILAEEQTPKEGMQITQKWLTSTQFRNLHGELERYSAVEIGKALEKLGYPAQAKKINGSVAQVRLLPDREWIKK
jgi:predicted P-loop ATPase